MRNTFFLLIVLHFNFLDHTVFGQQTDTTSLIKEEIDFKIDLAALNDHLGATYAILDLGLPIKLNPGKKYLITVGKWEIEKRHGQVQGLPFRRGNQFWPDPSRITQIVIQGPFNELIIYDGDDGQYKSLYKPVQPVDQIQLINPEYNKNKDHFLLCANQNIGQSGYSNLSVVSVQKESVTRILNDQYLIKDWVVNARTKELIGMCHSDINQDGMIDENDAYSVFNIELALLF